MEKEVKLKPILIKELGKKYRNNLKDKEEG